MSGTRIIGNILFISIILSGIYASAQEFAGHINWNPYLNTPRTLQKKAAKKTTTTLSLPFFEDFTGYSPYPDSNNWADFEVYVNNTMGASPISRGVATFDGLNAFGLPYDSFSYTTFRYADSLTSQPIDLSTDSAGDSVYFSFFYQPQGNGFFPLIPDSLMLYMKNRYGDFVKVWGVEGSMVQPFQQVMIPITDSLYFHNAFQFRFVNIAALYWADAIWNVDYIRLDRNRNIGDTTITDVAYTSSPSFLLNDYTSMPYKQFMANPAGELVTQVTDSVRNNTATSQTVTYTSVVYDAGTGGILSAAGPTNVTMGAYQTNQVTEPLSIGTYPSYPPNSSVVFETEYFLQTTSPLGSVVNDTVIHGQVFDNYLAYDDGTAEKSYYLNLFPSLPGKIAVEYHLNRSDTLRGMAIYFGRQLPIPSNKLFSIYIYSSLAGVNGAAQDVILDSTDLLVPGYDSVNHFWTYRFNTPLVLPAGTFYAGTLQPMGGSSDSLYIGLDVNRVGPNHAYYNVLGTWNPSLISGALMMRPILGGKISGSGIETQHANSEKWHVFPNPARNIIKLEFEGDGSAIYYLTDIQGRDLMHGTVRSGNTVDIAHLTPGMYFINITREGVPAVPQKFIKL